MIVIFVDDDKAFLEGGLSVLDYFDHEVERYSSVAEVESRFRELLETPFLVFVDHDLNDQKTGYDLVRYLRKSHFDGLLLPIVYLTGRETEVGYLAQERSVPFAHPTLYLSKRDMAETTFDLRGFVDQLIGDYEVAVAQREAQAVQRAINLFDRVDVTAWGDDD